MRFYDLVITVLFTLLVFGLGLFLGYVFSQVRLNKKNRKLLRGLTPAEISTIVQAKEDKRLIILPTKSEEVIRIVELALRMKLYDWQKAYILGESEYTMPGRTSGKTTAHIVRLCISGGSRIDMRKEMDRYIDEQHSMKYRKWFERELKYIYHELRNVGGIKLRDISFSDDYKREMLCRPIDIDYPVDRRGRLKTPSESEDAK